MGMQASGQSAGGRSPTAHEELSVGQMVLANRPWRLVRDLSKVLVATLASAGFFIVNSNAWGIADQLAIPILLLIAVLAVVGLGVWLAVAHSLWERPSQRRDPALTYRVNAATVLTLVLGLLFAYVVLYVVVLASMALVVPERFMASNLGHPARFADYAAAAWFAASMAVVVGAIGSGLESDEEVHETISRYRLNPPEEPPVGRASLPLPLPLPSKAAPAVATSAATSRSSSASISSRFPDVLDDMYA